MPKDIRDVSCDWLCFNTEVKVSQSSKTCRLCLALLIPPARWFDYCWWVSQLKGLQIW